MPPERENTAQRVSAEASPGADMLVFKSSVSPNDFGKKNYTDRIPQKGGECMEAYQDKYLTNVREIARCVRLCHNEAEADGEEHVLQLKAENDRIICDYLFPALDNLHGAEQKELDDLTLFADQLMDWKTNLDCGIYVVIHDALLSLCRVRRDREGIIRELYKLGMGLYYMNRMLEGVESSISNTVRFENEMVFTEAASYFRFFEQMEKEETKGYIIRSLANIAICSRNYHRRIATSARILQIVQDEEYKAQAPGLPWDRFLRGTHQQMSANRAELRKNVLSKEEMALVLDSCYEVFKPEAINDNPSIRWLWPYYDMEYACGYADLKTTIERLERLMESARTDLFDQSSMYGNVQLPIYYGRLIRENPVLQEQPEKIRTLDRMNRKMLEYLMNYPAEQFDDYYFYLINLVVTDYYDPSGVMPYREFIEPIIRRVGGNFYAKGCRAGKMLKMLCGALWDTDESTFDELPILAEITDSGKKKQTLLDYAEACGLYYDFGLIKMNITRIMQTRNLFEREFERYKAHTISGYKDLKSHSSTEQFAEVALGHHRWYNGMGGYPEEYVRLSSPYRQMTDAVAVIAEIMESSDREACIDNILEESGKQFSPIVTSCLLYLKTSGFSFAEFSDKDDRGASEKR